MATEGTAPDVSNPAPAASTVAAHARSTNRAEALRASAESTAISEVMSRNIVCLAPEARVEAVAQMFLERGISSAPIVDANWLPRGIVSKTDLLRTLCNRAEGESLNGGVDGGSTVGEVTMPYVLSLHEEAPVSVAAALMAYEGVHGLPIVASSGEVVGVVSTLDIIKWVARSTDLEVGAQEPAATR